MAKIVETAGEVMTTGELNRNLSAALARVADGHPIVLTRYGKAVATLIGPPADGSTVPDRTPTQKVAKGMLEIAKQSEEDSADLMAEDQLNKTSNEEVDDWGLPIESPVTAPDPPNPAPLKPYRQPMGLSKKQQAGQKYDR